MKVNWKTLKRFIDQTQLYHFLNYVEFDNEYYAWVLYQGENLNCVLVKGSQDLEDFLTNYKDRAVLKNDLGMDGIPNSKVGYVLKGNYLCALYVVFRTSNKETNDTTGLFSVKLYDESGSETQISDEAVKTCLDFRPNYAYELFSGGLEFSSPSGSTFYASAICAPEIPPEHGGHRYFVRNRRITGSGDFVVEAVGPGSIPYDPSIPVNVLRIEISHEKGLIQEFQFELKIYA